MAQSAGSPWLTVRKVIDCFVGMGCEPREFPDRPVEYGESWSCRYLVSPDGEGFVSLIDFDLDDRVSPLTLISWERVLGVDIPKGE